MNINQKEWHLLIEACHVAIRPANFFTKALKLEDIDYAILLKLAKYHKVVPLLNKGINKHPDKSVIPDIFLANLKRLSLNFALRNLKNAKELLRLQVLFKAADIDIIPYKGIVLSEMAYNELGIRESSDIDILVQKKDLDLIYEILEKEDYRPSIKASPFLYKQILEFYNEYNYDLYNGQARLFHVEPHWVLGKKMYQTSIGFEEIIPLTTENKLLDTTINKLTPEGLLITTIVHHGSAEGWLRLKNIIDIAAILAKFEKEINWALVSSICAKLNITNILLLGLSLSKELFDSSLPLEIIKLLDKKKIKQLTAKRKIDLSQALIKPHTISVFNRIIYQLRLRASWSTKIKVIYYHFLHFILRPFLSAKAKV